MGVEQAITMVLQAPLPQMIERMGLAIANAQFAMDKNAVDIARLLADKGQGVALIKDGPTLSLLELGFTPTFYHITEATIEAKVTFSAGESQQFSIGAKVGVNIGFFAASVDASYTAKYSFDASGSSAIMARFVSVPAPTVFSELLREAAKRPAETPS